MVDCIYLIELQLNEANSFNTEAPILGYLYLKVQFSITKNHLFKYIENLTSKNP